VGGVYFHGKLYRLHILVVQMDHLVLALEQKATDFGLILWNRIQVNQQKA